MSDIVARLRDWRSVHLARLHLLMDEAAAEIEQLRADWPEHLRLTDAEREAVEVAAESYADDHGERFAATLRALLERLGK